MDTIKKNGIATHELGTAYLTVLLHRENPPLYYRYDTLADSFYIAFGDRDVKAVGHDLDDHVIAYARLHDLEIVAFEFEAFRHSFLSYDRKASRLWKLSDTGLRLAGDGDLRFRFEALADETTVSAKDQRFKFKVYIYVAQDGEVIFTYTLAA